MNLFKSFIRNLILSNTWSIAFVIFASAICADLLVHDGSLIMFFCWFGNAIISFFIHSFLFVPGLILYKKRHTSHNTLQAYFTIYPLLLLPLALYSFLISLILLDSYNPEPNSFGIGAFIGIVLMAMHSISLYTFIQHHFKNTDHEKINS